MVEKPSVVRVQGCREFSGEVSPPGDKSLSHRAVLFNSFASGTAHVSHLAPGKDCRSTVSCLRALGAHIEPMKGEPDSLLVHGAGPNGYAEPRNVLNAGNSGTTIRLLTGVLAAQPFFSVVTGDASLRARPMRRVIDPLRLMGAEVRGRSGDSLAPLAIRGGKLHGIEYALPVASAQLKSAILLAAVFAQGETVIREPAPSRDHTERLLRRMGVPVRSEGASVRLSPPGGSLPALDLRVPGDISSGAFWMVAAAIHKNASVTIKDCGVNPTRAGILDVLRAMGARLTTSGEHLEGDEPVADITVESSRLKGAAIGGDLVPRVIDEIPVLAVAACLAEGETIIKDAAELRVKESDRVATTVAELRRMGADIEERPDGMVIHGGRPLRGCEVSSHLDHRLAMSLAVAALVARGETVIRQAESVAISYPGFWDDLARLSGRDYSPFPKEGGRGMG